MRQRTHAVLRVAAPLVLGAAAWWALAGGGATAWGRPATPAEADAYPGLPYLDVEGSVGEALRALKPRGVLAAFPGDRFRPDRPITVGEFARAAAAAFGLTVPDGPSPDEAAVTALEERSVLPPAASGDADLPLSRASLLSAAVRLAGMGELASSLVGIPGDEVFVDLSPEHPAHGAARLAHAAGLLPEGYEPRLQPALPATRGEAVVVLHRARQLSVVTGAVSRASADRLVLGPGDGPPAGKGGVAGPGAPGGGDALPLAGQALVLRNGRPATPAQLRAGDQVSVVVDPAGRIRVVAARGRLETAEWVEQGRAMLRALARQLTPEQWQAILRGDWQGFVGSLTPQLYDQLMAMGVAPWEAEALLNRDWPAVVDVAKDRLAREGADRLGVSPEVLRAVLDEDWVAARQLAQQELLQKLLDQLVGPDVGAA